MAKSFYLMNGVNRVGQALYLDVNGNLKKEFEDISTLDLLTMDIKKKDAKPMIREYNPGVDIDGMFYDLAKLKNGKVNCYAPIFNYDKTILDKYYNYLRYFAEQRDFKVKHNDKVKLDDNSKLEYFIEDVLYKIIDNKVLSLTEYESLLSKKLKEIIKDKYEGKSYKLTTGKYIDSKKYLITDILRNYTELRNITLSYMLYLSGYSSNVRHNIAKTEHWTNLGIDKEASEIKVVNCEQLELADYINAPKVRRLDKKGNPIL